MEPTWTISELAAAAAAVLDDAPVQVNGRVRDLPNERLIRWYTTIGLLDPPSGRRGRTALYGERHLLQLVAIKRRQAAGRTIAQIQAELLGATNTTLRAIAGIPDVSALTTAGRNGAPSAPDAAPTGPAGEPTTGPAAGSRRRRAAGGPGAADAAPTERRAARTGRRQTSPPPSSAPDAGRAPGAPTEHDDAPVTDTAPGRPAADDTAEDPRRPEPTRRRFWARGVPAEDPPAHPPSSATDLAPIHGVRLAPGVRLILDAAALTLEDVQAIGEAAEPLLAELRRRGLTHDSPSPDAPAPPSDLTGRHP